MNSGEERRPIVIYGAPRSGTTYLASILNAHPDIFISNETRIFAWLHQSLAVLPGQEQFALRHREVLVEHLRAELPDLVRSFYRRLQPEARYWGDKNPHYAARENRGCLEMIDELFPGARFIHIIRDGRDVVASLIRKRHPDGRPWANWERAHQIWMNHVDLGSTFGRGLPPDRYFELRYEHLIRDDVAIARRIFDFLDIEIHPDVAEFCGAQLEERTPLSGPTRDLAEGAATSDWESILTPEQRAYTLRRLRDHLVRYGYATESTLAASIAGTG